MTKGEYYTLYHGFPEARPVSEEEIDATIERRRNLFTTGLEKMKEIAETQ